MSQSVQGLCESRGLSLLELAETSGVEIKRLQAIYLGRWTPSPDERTKIAAALETPVDDIAWGHNTPIQHIYGHGPS